MAFEVEFSKRLDLFGAEIFAALNDKKVALEAQGKKLYNLSVGTPDFEPMPHIKQALCDAAMVSENWKYSLRDCRNCWIPCALITSAALMWTA